MTFPQTLPKQLEKDTPKRPVNYEAPEKDYEGKYSVTEDELTGMVIHVWCQGHYQSFSSFGNVAHDWMNVDKLARDCLNSLVVERIHPGLST